MANSQSGDAMIDRVVRILSTFDDTHRTQTAAQIARAAEIPPSSAHRIISSLIASGVLEHDEDSRVRIGIKLWELTVRGSQALRLRQIAMPFMDDVQTSIRQHTQLAIREHDQVIVVERLSAQGSGVNLSKVAGRLPIHASSSGLTLLAFSPAEVVETVLASPLTALTPNTITDARSLRNTLAEIRQSGYAFSAGYVNLESAGIAVPIMHAPGQVIAALSVVVPRNFEHTEQAVVLLKRAAKGIARSLRDEEKSLIQ